MFIFVDSLLAYLDSFLLYYIFDAQRDGVLHIAIPVTAFTTIRDFFYFRTTRLVSPRLLPPLYFKCS